MIEYRNDKRHPRHAGTKAALTALAAFLAIAITPDTSSAVRVTFQEGLAGYVGTLDNSIYQELLSNSNGGGQSIIVGRTGFTNGGNRRRGLISFDLSSLPIGIFITDATLVLNVSFGVGGARPMNIHRLLKDWGEGTVDAAGAASDVEGTGAPAAAGNATWRSNHHNQDTWTSLGGDFAAQSSGAGTTPNTANGNGAILIRGAGLIADLQSWVDGIEINNGWILIGDESVQGTGKRIRSSESPLSGERPMLIIEYSNTPLETPTPTPTETPTETPTPTFTETPIIAETPTPTQTLTPTPTLGAAPSADLNNDGIIDEKDLLLFLGEWHKVGI